MVGSNVQTINIDGKKKGLTYEGIGGVSAGASSRLLVDYPEKQKKDILDLLFIPKFGASLQHLKVEIGGDVMSTDGTEASVIRTMEEYIDTAAHIDDPDYQPNIERFNRGYEFWLVKEAKTRNPRIYLDCLQWGASEWVRGDAEKGEEGLYSQRNADLIAMFVKGAKTYHGLEFDYVGATQNEMTYNREWVKVLRKTLDRNGLSNVKIVGPDTYDFKSEPPLLNLSNFKNDLLNDIELWNAMHAFGVHYRACPTEDFFSEIIAKGMPCWNGEDGVWGVRKDPDSLGTFNSALIWANILNINYINNKLTKNQIWSPVSAYYNAFPISKSGLIDAVEPWSGHYDIFPAFWATAHTTQFAEPGWLYLGENGCGTLNNGGTYVTLMNPDTGDFSIVIETKGAPGPQELDFVISNMKNSEKKVWRTYGKDTSTWFKKDIEDILRDSGFRIVVQPDSIITVTTTTGQQKGEDMLSIPKSGPYPLPYVESFEEYEENCIPRYISNYYSYFEVAGGDGTDGVKCLMHKGITHGVSWGGQNMINSEHDPAAVFGDAGWRDYIVSVDAKIEGGNYSSYIQIWGHVWGYEGRGRTNNCDKLQGIYLKVNKDGSWLLGGVINNPDEDMKANYQKKSFGEGSMEIFDTSKWHTFSLKFTGKNIEAYINGNLMITAVDTEIYNDSGMAAIGCSRDYVKFDRLMVQPINSI